MALDVVTLQLAKKYTALTALGLGAVKGANCVVKDIVENDDGTTVTLGWTGTDGTKQEREFTIENGVGVVDAEIRNDHLIFELSDGNELDAGELNLNVDGESGVWIGTSEPPKDKDYVLWIDPSEEMAGAGGGGVLSKEIVATTAIGSVTKGKKYPAGTSLEKIIRDILIAESAPGGVLSYLPIDKFYDVITDTVEDITLKINVIKNTYPIAKIEFYVNDVIVETLDTEEDVKDGGAFSYAHYFDTPTNENIKLKVVITDTNGLKVSPNTVIKFVGRSYFGYVAETVTTPTDADIKGLQNSTLKDKSTLTYEDIPLPQDGNLYKILYGYPKEFGKINKIVDADGRDYTASYTENIVEVDGIDYYTYILTDGTGAAGATQKFS